MTEYYEIGTVIQDPDELALYPETAALWRACERNPYIEFLELRREDYQGWHSEFVVIHAGNGNVATGNPADIRRSERLAIEINPALRVPVIVRTLRKDFPALSHQHCWVPGTPRTLCLYEVSWSTVERSWTAERFLEKMFWWLGESSELKLHRDDQPMEQLFYDSPYKLILPANHAEYANDDSKRLILERVDQTTSITFKAVPAGSVEKTGAIQILALSVEPVASAEVVMFPFTLGALDDQLTAWGSGLFDQLEASIRQQVAAGIRESEHSQEEGLLILVWVPRLRHGEVAGTDVKGYLVRTSLLDLAKKLDVVGPADNEGRHFAIQLIGVAGGEEWKNLSVLPVEVWPSLNETMARDMSAIDAETAEFSAVLAGVGALGSALGVLWTREGWGRWTFVDPDQLLPHNLTRHVAFNFHTGFRKAEVLKEISAEIYPYAPKPKAFVMSVVDPNPELRQVICTSQLVVDVTTTFEAPRELALMDDAPRTVSLFLTPSGLSSVMLLEDKQRSIRVDALEGQYYRAIIQNDWGGTHLKNHLGDRWVGGGCRDVSLRMSGECIQLHAGILSGQLRKSVLAEAARLCIWESDEASGSVTAHEIPVYQVTTHEIAGWRVKLDLGLVDKIRVTRAEALPLETGGIIVGITDLKSKTIVIVDVLPTPADSDASNTHFIRGREGQTEALAGIHNRTARIVDYIGEWHSHPAGHSAKASPDDEKLLASLSERMSVEGLPALMLILAGNELQLFVR